MMTSKSSTYMSEGSTYKMQFVGKLWRWSFSLLIVAVFSRLFSEGIVNLFFYLALIFGSFYAFQKRHTINLANVYSKPLLYLLVLYFLVILFSTFLQSISTQSLFYLFEFRILLCTPLFIFALYADSLDEKKYLKLIYGVLMLSLILKFLDEMGFWFSFNGILEVRGAHIINGWFNSIALIFLCIHLTVAQKNVVRIVVCLAIFIVFANVFLESGRLAVLQIISVMAIYLYIEFRSLKYASMMFFSFLCLGIVLAIVSIEHRGDLVDQFISYSSGEILQNSLSERLTWITYGLKVFSDNPFFGVGAKGYADLLSLASISGDLQFPTDNIHNSFVNSMVIAGSFGFAVLTLWFWVWFLVSWRILNISKEMSFGLLAFWFIVLQSSLLNSTFKDFGEKTIFGVVFSVVFVSMVRLLEGKNSDDVR